jgi:preprotein translocase subunit Sss1
MVEKMSEKQQQSTDLLTDLIEGPKEFIRDSIHLINRCTKPDRRGFFSSDSILKQR